MAAKTSSAALSAAIYVALAGALAVLVLSVTGLTVRGVLLMAIVFALLLPLAWRNVRGRLDVFEPVVLANIASGVMFVGRPLFDLITGNTAHLGYSVLPTFDEALLVALIGIVFFELGYFVSYSTGWSRRLPAPPPLRPRRAAFAGWFYLVAGGALFGVFLGEHGGLGLLLLLLEGRQQSNNELFIGSTGYFYNGILMWGASSLVFFAVAATTNRKIHWLCFLIPTLCLLIFQGARGTRINLLPLVLAIPVYWYLQKGQRPRARTLVIGVLVGVCLLGWLRDIRVAGENRDFGERLIAALVSPVEEAVQILGGRDAEMFDSLANELLVVPEALSFQHGATVTDVLIRAVPRPLWPTKPLESNDAVLSVLWPVHYSSSRAAPAFSLVGVLYADTGYFTVALGMFFVGAMLATVWRWLQRYHVQPVAQMIYAMGLPFVVVLLRGTIPDTLGRMLFLFAPLVLLLWAMRFSIQPVKRNAVGRAIYRAAIVKSK